MTGHRMIQNFRGGRALLLATQDSTIASLYASLDGPLRKLGVTLAQLDSIVPEALDCNRDIVLLDLDSDIKADALLPPGATVPLAPVIGLVGVEAPSRLISLVTFGATSFLRKPIHGATVYASLFLAVNGYHRLSSMGRRLAEHESRKHGRRFIIKAVVHLVTTQGMSDDDAYVLLRRESMRARQSLEKYCESFTATSMVQWSTQQPIKQESENETQIVPDHSTGGDARNANVGGAGRRPDKARRA